MTAPAIRSPRIAIWVVLLLLAGLAPGILCAQAYVTNGTATQIGDVCYQLTTDGSSQSGNIFSTATIDLTQAFTLDATLFFGCKDANGADGIVFLFATTNTMVGGGGGGIGYQGITPSIGIEMDDYFNGEFGDPTPDHMAVISNGSTDHNAPTSLAGPVNLPNVEDCEEHCFVVAWDPVTQTLAAALDDEVITYTGNIVNTIFGGNPLVYYGFTASTGGLSNIHRICFGPPDLQPMADVTLCEGESVDLQADEQGIAWTWAPDPSLSALNVSDPTATPDETTTYTVEIEYKCGYIQNDTVIVVVNPLPVAEADNNGPICDGETLQLTSSGGTSYDWDGPAGFSSTSQNPTRPNFTENMAGTYYVTVTDANGCTAEAETEVEYDMGPEIFFDPLPDPLCLNEPPFVLTADPPGGTWDGDITPGGLFDPEYVGVGIHTVTYTVSNADGCSRTEELMIEVLGIPTVSINAPTQLCAEASPVQFTATPPGGFWEGNISFNGLFNPATAGPGQHIITYTANDGAGCTNSAQVTIQVVPGVMVDIEPPGPFCVTEDLVQLYADPPGGTWGGDVNALGEFSPSAVGPGFHFVSYTFVDSQGCYFGEADLEVVDAPQASITAIPALCPDEVPATLSATPSGGTWSGAADASGVFDPAANGPGTHDVIYTYTSGAGCTDSDTFMVTVLPVGPIVANITEICDSTSTTYVVLFSISGGDPATYEVQGTVPGTITPGNPAIFTSEPIANGSSYTFTIDDGNRCAPVTITGDHECLCATNAGSMDLTPITACAGETITVTPPTGVVLDPDDALVYVLHAGDPLNPIVISDSTVFAFLPPLQTGVTYFISSMAGNGAPGGVDTNDPCLSVSFGTPVQWLARPDGFLTVTTPICRGQSATVTFELTGAGPFIVQYAVGANVVTLNGISTGYTLQVTPTDTTTYTLVQVALFNLPGCVSTPNAAVTLEVIPPVTGTQTLTLCAGDSLFVGGAWQTTDGTYSDALTSAAGCDSIRNTTLVFLPADTTYQFDTSCDPAQTGVFVDTLTTQAGCDSILVTTVTYAESDTTLLFDTTCDPQLAGVFTDLYTTQEGCDSLVITTITLLPSDTVTVAGESCDPADAGMFTELLTNRFGCDSLVITTIALLPSDTATVTGETCDPGEAGMFTELLTNRFGCDSLVMRSIALLPSDTTDLYGTTCEEADTGVFETRYLNIFGCDSLVRTTVALLPYDSCHVPPIPMDVGLPNVFSPNGDGINDRFFVSAHPDALERIPVMRIFDRWGGLVSERTDILPNRPDDGWDGTFKGEPVNPGVYVWVVVLRFADGHEEARTGDVTLLR